MKKHSMIAAALLLIGASAPAGAADGFNVRDFAAVMQQEGFRAAMETDSTGDPMIVSGASGADFRVYFFDCEAGSCTSAWFTSGFDKENGWPMRKVNDWNAKWRFAYAYLDDENDPYLAMDIELRGGMTKDQLVFWLQRWEEMLGKFASQVWNDDDGIEAELQDGQRGDLESELDTEVERGDGI